MWKFSKAWAGLYFRPKKTHILALKEGQAPPTWQSVLCAGLAGLSGRIIPNLTGGLAVIYFHERLIDSNYPLL